MTARILVVDDDPDMLGTLRLVLECDEWEILTARGGAEALQAAARYAPDLILLDIMMPDMDGFEVCRRLRADARFHDTPIVALTALDGIEDRLLAYRAGFSEFMSKLSVLDELVERIQSFLRPGHHEAGELPRLAGSRPTDFPVVVWAQRV